jgi:hypothetical protein
LPVHVSLHKNNKGSLLPAGRRGGGGSSCVQLYQWTNCRVNVFENRVPWTILGSVRKRRREEVTVGWIQLNEDVCQFLLFTRYCWSSRTKDYETCRACNMHWRDQKCMCYR